jgi:hypothetical protein
MECGSVDMKLFKKTNTDNHNKPYLPAGGPKASMFTSTAAVSPLRNTGGSESGQVEDMAWRREVE